MNELIHIRTLLISLSGAHRHPGAAAPAPGWDHGRWETRDHRGGHRLWERGRGDDGDAAFQEADVAAAVQVGVGEEDRLHGLPPRRVNAHYA